MAATHRKLWFTLNMCESPVESRLAEIAIIGKWCPKIDHFEGVRSGIE